MNTDKLEDIRRSIADLKRVGGTWYRIHVTDAEELVASVWPKRPGIKPRVRVPATTKEVAP